MERSAIINALSSGLSKFIGVFKKNGVILSSWVVLIFILLYSFIINPLDINTVIKEIEKDKSSQHSISVDKRLLADQVIPTLLKNMRLEYNLNRVCLLEMHNSTENVNSVSFLYMSMVYENFDFHNDSIMPIMDMYQNQRTGGYADIFKAMQRKGYVYFENMDDYKRDFGIQLVKKVHHNGAKSMMLVPIFNKNRIDAILVLTSFNPTMDTKSIGEGLYKPVETIKSLIF